MRVYEIYYIKRDVAHQYYRKEIKIFRLFQEQKNCPKYLKPIIEQQIKYITSPIPVMPLQRAIKQHLKSYKLYREENFTHYLELKGGKSKAHLEISLRKMTLMSEGSIEAETIFFEAIRQIAANFLAIDIENERYGWLNPIKEWQFI